MKKTKAADPRDGWYTFEPTSASKLLDDQLKNRPLAEHRAQRIAADIASGRWRENGEAIIFDAKGRVMDGQHRLRACVIAAKPFTAYCVFGVSYSVFPTLDQSAAARSSADLASLMGFVQATTVSACARLAILYAEGRAGTQNHQQTAVSNDRMRPYLDRNREKLQAAALEANRHRGLLHMMPMSHAAWLLYQATDELLPKAIDFIQRLETGANLQNGDAALLFRERMKSLAGARHGLRQFERLALLVKAWNGFVSGKKAGQLKFNPDVEKFPKLIQDVADHD